MELWNLNTLGRSHLLLQSMCTVPISISGLLAIKADYHVALTYSVSRHITGTVVIICGLMQTRCVVPTKQFQTFPSEANLYNPSGCQMFLWGTVSSALSWTLIKANEGNFIYFITLMWNNALAIDYNWPTVGKNHHYYMKSPKSSTEQEQTSNTT